MSFLSAIRVALSALLVNKGRSVLTSLGIVIGISAVIAMVSASTGLRGFVDERLERLGTNLILIEPGGRTGEGMITDFTPLTVDDANAIRDKLKHLLRNVAPSQMTLQMVFSKNRSHGCRVVGSTHALQDIRKWQVHSPGRFFSDDDDKNGARVCVIGHKARQALFPNDPNPVNEVVRMGSTQLRIVGVLKEKGTSPTGADQDDQILMPLSTLQRYIKGDPNIALILAAARDKGQIQAATEAISELMQKRHGLRKGAKNQDFHVRSVEEQAKAGLAILDSIQALTIVIASISLIVGGIGIMNIMLVSVTERTREIGIRMAIGATPGDVLRQFLIEAVVLASVGGLIGITLGIAAAAAVGIALQWPVEPNYVVIVFAFIIAAGVGVFFGFYPARKASRLDPIEALRYE
jgi:putative ABC transport system permease protein